MGTNRAFLGKADGKGTGQRGKAGMGTNSAFMGKSDGAGQSTKAMRTQKLAAVTPFMKGQDAGDAMAGLEGSAAAYAAANVAHVAPKAKKASKAKGQSKKAVRTQKLYEWVELPSQPARPFNSGDAEPHSRVLGYIHPEAPLRGVIITGSITPQPIICR